MRYLLATATLAFILLCPRSFAGEFYTGPEMQPDVPDVCQGTLNPDVCMWSPMTNPSGSSTLCSNTFGCPICGYDQTLTKAVCFILQGQNGKCSCREKGVGWDRNGNRMPLCDVSGSCVVRR
jgi:hypothetical protein